MGVAPAYLADKSALARLHLPAVRDALLTRMRAGLVATCAIVELEVLYSTRSPAEYERIRTARRNGFVALPLTQETCDRALGVQQALAQRSQHRAAGIPDLLIAACAELNGVTLVHYDADFELIAEITGQRTEWVVPRGSVS